MKPKPAKPGEEGCAMTRRHSPTGLRTRRERRNGTIALLDRCGPGHDADSGLGMKARQSQSNTCNGDSGGGVFMVDYEGQRKVEKMFGVVSGGTDADCIKNDESYNVDISQFSAWLEQAGEGRLATRQCGEGSPSPRERKTQRALVRLSEGKPEEFIKLEIPIGARRLQLAANAEDDGTGKNAFELLIQRGAQIKDARPFCAQSGGQFLFCDFAQPEPGTWSILLKRQLGGSEMHIQVMASIITGSVR